MFSLSATRTGVLVLAGLLLAQAGCGHHGDDSSPPAAEVPLVTVETLTRGNLKRTILQPGYTRPYEQTPIYARVQGYVGEVNVDRGYLVKKGTLLAQLRVPELEQGWKAKSARAEQAKAQVQQAVEGLKAASANVKTFDALILETKAAIDKAEAEQMRWQSEYARTQKLYLGGTFPKQVLDENFYQWQATKAGLAQARAKNQFALAALSESQAKEQKAAADLEAAKQNVQVAAADRDQAKVWYDFRNIEAPYDGIVTVRNVHPGQFLQVSSSGSTNKSAEPMFQFVNMDPLRVVVQVPEYDASLVRADEDDPKVKGYGSPTHITFQGLNDNIISGTVTLKADVLDLQAHTLTVEIHLANKDRKLLPGMYVNAAIEVETAKTWMLPLQAIYTDGEKSYCFVVEPAAAKQGKAVKTALKLGVANDSVVEVLKKQATAAAKVAWVNVTGQEMIVSSNPESLLDGQMVKFETK